jgi:hypothetical protein
MDGGDGGSHRAPGGGGRKPARASLLLAGLAIAALPVRPTIGDGDPFGAMVGEWHGRATETPAGSLPYDIRFTRLAACAVTGAANPGAAVHSWTFYTDRGRPRLRFLTTFGGNTEPLDLAGVSGPDGAITFRSERSDLVRVRLVPGTGTTRISVALRGEPHVEILLRRKPLGEDR